MKIQDETVDMVPEIPIPPDYGSQEAPAEDGLPAFFRAPSQRRPAVAAASDTESDGGEQVLRPSLRQSAF